MNYVISFIFKIFRYFINVKVKIRLIIFLTSLFYAFCLFLCLYFEYKIANNLIHLESIKFLLKLKQTLIINEKLFVLEEINSNLFFLHNYEIISNYEQLKIFKFIFLMTVIGLPLYFGYINANDINCTLNTKRLITKYLKSIPLVNHDTEKAYISSTKIIGYNSEVFTHIQVITQKTDLTSESYNILCYHYLNIKNLTDAFFRLEYEYKINSFLINENNLEILHLIELSNNNSFLNLSSFFL